jgi:hypothetical protein
MRKVRHVRIEGVESLVAKAEHANGAVMIFVIGIRHLSGVAEN